MPQIAHPSAKLALGKPVPGGLVRSYRGQAHFEVAMGGVRRSLPMVQVERGVWIASDADLILGDTVFIQRCAELLASRLRRLSFDLLLTAEAKAIPLTFAISSLLKKERFLVARKGVKKYVAGFVEESVSSITTQGEQKLILSAGDALLVRGKRICILDDVVSTGQTLDALSRLTEKAGGRVVARCAIWKEGPWYPSRTLIHLGTLPVFTRP